MTSPNRLVPLDLLRAIAVLLVLGRHAIPFPDDAWPPLLAVFRVWHRVGWMGVDLFFVLSGFLVSGLLFREYLHYQKLNIARFLIRRGFKIYPAFYFFIIACSLVQAFQRPQLLSELFFMQSYFPAMWPHTWSLAVEEHFYLCLAPLLFLLAALRRGERDPFRALPALCALLGVTLLILRAAAVARHGPDANTLTPTHLRIDSLFFGVLLSYFYNFHGAAFEQFVHRRRIPMTVCGLLLILPPFFMEQEDAFIRTAGFTMLYVGFGSLLVVLLVCGEARFRTPSRWARFWAFLGSHSYSVYLWHFPMRIWVMQMVLPELGIHLNYWAGFLAYVAACFGWGVFVAMGIEFPMLRVRDRLFPARSRAIAAS